MVLGFLLMVLGCWSQPVDCLSLLADLYDCFGLLGSAVVESAPYIGVKDLTTDSQIAEKTNYFQVAID